MARGNRILRVVLRFSLSPTSVENVHGRDPQSKPEALFALRHFSFLVCQQCDRLIEAAYAQEQVRHLADSTREFDEARDRVLGERYFLLCAGREMVRAIEKLRLGRLPKSMHDELRHFRDALTHWDEWGTPKSKAAKPISASYPNDWPYQLQVKDGDILVGGSLKVSEIERAAQRLYEWTRDPSLDHGLFVPPDPHAHKVHVTLTKSRFLPVARALGKAGFKCAGGNSSLWVWLLKPSAVSTVKDLVRSIDPDAQVGPVEEIDHDEDDE